MNVAELKQKSDTELTESLHELLKQQFSLRMRHGSGQMPHTHELRQVRRDIARVKTIMAGNRGGSKS